MRHSQLHQRYRGKEGEDHGRCGRSRWAFLPGDVLIMVAEMQADLPLDHSIHEQPHDREHSQGRKPCGFLQPHGTDRGRVLDPAKARFHRDMLFLIRLEHLDIRTLLGPQCGGQDRPPMCLLSGKQGLWVHDQAIADLNLGNLGLRRTASPRPLFGSADCFHMIVEHMRAPEARRTAPPSRPTAGIVAESRLGVGRTGTPASFHALDVLGDTLGLLGLGGGIRRGRLLGSLARVDDQKTSLCHVETPVCVLHGHATDDALPMPASRRLLPGPSRFFEH